MTPQEFKDWRSHLGLTQAQAGQALGYTSRWIIAFEQGINHRRKPCVIPLSVELACKWISIRCETCSGTGVIDAPFSGSDPTCPDCFGTEY